MSNVFISYRRSDSQDVAGRIYDRLIACFTPRAIFKDVVDSAADSLPLGILFREFIVRAIDESEAVLVLIGPTWVSCKDSSGGRRLESNDDVVRLEVETALRRNRPTIPVVVSNAQFPRVSELPESIKELAARSGQSVRPDPDFEHDMKRLIESLEGIAGIQRTPPANQQAPNREILERLMEMVKGWHSEVIDTSAQLQAADGTAEAQRILFRYLNTRNFLAQLEAIRKHLQDLPWATKLLSQVDNFVSLLAYRDPEDHSMHCVPILHDGSKNQSVGLDVTSPSKLLLLHVALQKVTDEIISLISNSVIASRN
ncbi:MAG: toll/interleukin-1 receptor domain-containing protein [Planctomycetaceae bacterium]